MYYTIIDVGKITEPPLTQYFTTTFALMFKLIATGILLKQCVNFIWTAFSN